MPRGRTRSSLNRSERIERAYELFARGYTNADVARELRVSPDTVTSYRRLYEEKLRNTAESNPNLFNEVLLNTQRQIVELDQVRKDAWAQIRQNRRVSFTCENCGEDGFIDIPISDANRSKFHKTILTAQQMRAQLHQLLNNRTEVLIRHENTQIAQRKILAWMKDHLPLEMREQLAMFIETELTPLMGELPAGPSSLDPDPDILDAEVISDTGDESD